MRALSAKNRHAGPHAPIFRAKPQPKAVVQPVCVFAAGRESFEVIVRALVLAPPAKAIIFEALPLAEHGWEFASTTIERAGTSADKWPIWRISRG